MKTEYKTEIYLATQLFILGYLSLMLLIFILIIFGIILKIPPLLGTVVCIGALISPFAFEKKIKQLFTRKIFLEFDNMSFSITTYQLRSEKAATHLNFKWSEIKSYKFYFSPAKNTILTLHFKNGKSKTWGFKDGKTSQEAVNGESLFKIFLSFINEYNFNKDSDERIVLNLGFLNSKSGTILLSIEIFIIISGFIFHIFIHPQSSFLTLLIGSSLVLQQFLKRKQERLLHYKISLLETGDNRH